LIFVVEIINELEKECDNNYEDLHEDWIYKRYRRNFQSAQ
jgi:hypothetical protein